MRRIVPRDGTACVLYLSDEARVSSDDLRSLLWCDNGFVRSSRFTSFSVLNKSWEVVSLGQTVSIVHLKQGSC